MMILAHRANIFGPNRQAENSLMAVRQCLDFGWGVEIDMRRSLEGSFYISHDDQRWSIKTDADAYFSALRSFPKSTWAINVKELGYEKELLDYLIVQGVLGQVFLFDMELLEHAHGVTARKLRSFSPKVELAARASDRNESIENLLLVSEARITWLDEFDSLWITEDNISKLKSLGKRIFAISPEIHGFSLIEMERRWRQFIQWGIDGICTDYPMKLSDILVEEGASEL
jgi:glycerophosphoryl diester phosphodiesterase